MAYTFVVSDESVVNSYGIRVMTKGIDIKQYKKNPIVLWFHKRPRQWDSKNDPKNEALPIGRAIKLWKDDGKLYAEVEFDQNDEFAKKIESKVEGKYINMCSPGLTPVDISDDSKNMLPGQKRVTLMKSELEELSIADIGSNKNALRLYNEDRGYLKLSDGDIDNILPLVDKQTEPKILKLNMDKILVADKLGLDPNAADQVILAALGSKIQLAAKANDYKTKMEAAEAKLTENAETDILQLVNANVDKKFTADKKDHFLNLGKTIGKVELSKTFDAMPEIGKPSDVIPGNGQQKPEGGGESETLTFAKLREQGLDAIEKYKNENRADYIRLYKAEYGIEPEID